MSWGQGQEQEQWQEQQQGQEQVKMRADDTRPRQTCRAISIRYCDLEQRPVSKRPTDDNAEPWKRSERRKKARCCALTIVVGSFSSGWRPCSGRQLAPSGSAPAAVGSFGGVRRPSA